MAKQRIEATLIPGDGIGPEITAAVVEILDALGAPFEWETQQGGMAAIAGDGRSAPRGAPRRASAARKLALKGPLATPVGGGFRSVNVRLREAFQLYANLRPARTLVPGGRYEDIDLVLVRENLEGLYVALRALHPDRRRPARGGDLLRRQHARRVAAHRGVRVRLRGEARPQEGHHRPQGQRAQGADRRVPGDGAGRRRRSTPGRCRSTTGSSTRARCSWCSTRGSST